MNSKKLLYTAVGLAVFIGIAVGGFFTLLSMAQNQVPGQWLYTFKTTFGEKFLKHTKLTTNDQALYDVTLLANRVNELNRLSLDTSTSSEEELAAIAKLAENHLSDALTALSQDTSLDAQTRIDTLAKIDSVSRAAEVLTDTNDEFLSIRGQFSALEEKPHDALQIAIADFATTNATDTLEAFIADHIAIVSTEVKKTAPGSSAQRVVLQRITDTQDAIIDHLYGDAITAIIRAEQAIAIDGYLFDSERGPIEGIPVNPPPIPEGN